MDKNTKNTALAFFLLSNVLVGSSLITLNSSVPAEEYLGLCPRQEIVFTCVVKGSPTIAWSSVEYIEMGSDLAFGTFSTVGETKASPLNPTTLASLTKNDRENGVTVLESTLHIETLGNISNFSIACSNASDTKTSSFQMLGEPNMPRDVTLNQKTVSGPECALLLIGWNAPSNVANRDITSYAVYNTSKILLTERTNVDGNFTVTAYQACNCNDVNISVSATNRCGQEGRRSPPTTLRLDQDTTDVERHDCETVTTPPSAGCDCYDVEVGLGVVFAGSLVAVIVLGISTGILAWLRCHEQQ